MKAAETLIAWNAADGDDSRDTPPGSVAVGPLLNDGDPDWTHPYRCTGGAAWSGRHKLSGLIQQHHVLRDWYTLVYACGLHPYVVHRAFLHIDEYQDIIKAAGCGPARDEFGHDPSVPYGRWVRTPLPKIQERRIGQSVHIWPVIERVKDRV